MTQLSYDVLREAVSGGAVALRSRAVLQPAGGPGSKVFPPTYGVPDRAETKYAVEDRLVDGRTCRAVLLASVADQANRMELGLLSGLESGQLAFPNPYVDFTESEDLADLGRISALQAPHRLADAVFRDSMLDGTLFRLSDLGRRVTDATPDAATALYAAAPHALVFGMWDSTGPKGGLGARFQRALVSEIVGEDAQPGISVGSRVDPLQIARSAAVVYEAEDPDERWTLDEALAKRERGRPVEFKIKHGGDSGRPAAINHGNVTPSLNEASGGVTVSRAVQTTVLSLAALRKLRFPRAVDDSPLQGEERATAELAARTALAALAVAAIAYQREQDYDLRSRCLLIPEAAPVLEMLPRYGTTTREFELSADHAAELLRAASEAAAGAGMGWPAEQTRLVPAPKLKDLIRRSRAQLSSVVPGEGGGD